MGKSQRDKGLNFERALVRLFKALGWTGVTRNYSETATGNTGDVRASVSSYQFVIQAKRVEKLNFWKGMREAEEAAISSEVPILIARRSREEAMVCMRLSDFARVVERDQRPYGQYIREAGA